MKKKIGLFLVAFMVLTSLAYAQPLRNVLQKGFDYTPITKTYFSANAVSTVAEVWAPASGKRITLTGGIFNSALAMQFKIHTSSSLVSPYIHNTASGIVVLGSGTPIWRGAVDEALLLTTLTVGYHSLYLWGYEE